MDRLLDVYTIDLNDAAGDSPLQASRRTGTQVVKKGTVDVGDLSSSTSSKFGIDVRSFDELWGGGGHEPETRLLQVPALNVRAAWLRGHGAHGDRVVPLAPVPSFLVAGRAYGPAEFAEALRPAAVRRLSFVPDEVEERRRRIED